MIGFLALYAAAVAILTPQYFRISTLLGPAYAGFGRDPFLHGAGHGARHPGVFLAALAGVALLPVCSASDTLARCSWWRWLASFVAGAAQQKGWTYHFYPARVFALILLGAGGAGRPAAACAAGAAGIRGGGVRRVGERSCSCWLRGGHVRVLQRDPARQAEQAQLDELVAAVRRHVPPGGSLYIFSYTIGSSFPLVNYSGVRWASRFPHLWIIEAAYQDQLTRAAPLRFHPPRRWIRPNAT